MKYECPHCKKENPLLTEVKTGGWKFNCCDYKIERKERKEKKEFYIFKSTRSSFFICNYCFPYSLFICKNLNVIEWNYHIREYYLYESFEEALQILNLYYGSLSFLGKEEFEI